jgi:heme-degrading monooxygenase HmoA
MIARVWSARTTPAQAPAYAEHLRAHVVPALRRVAGYAGMKLLERPLPGAVEVVVITFWQSAEAVRGFAGDDPEQAVVADEAAALLTDFDRRVRHYEVLADDAPAA